mgnify:CR=1 FL=1
MSNYQTINLTRFGPRDDKPCRQHAWPMTVVAEGINMPSEIFVYRVENPNKNGDTFRCVSAVNDLYEFPAIRSPFQDNENWIPYYRRSQVELVMRNAQQADHVWKQIQEDVHDLIENYNLLLNMQTTGFFETSTNPVHQTTDTLPTMSEQKLIQLDYRPNGTGEIDSNNNQFIEKPFNFDVRGWLPVDQKPNSFVESTPEYAKFFYNIQKHQDLRSLFPLDQPFNKHLVYYEGNKLKEGLHYKVTSDTIYWLDFKPESQKEYGIINNAPWNPDFIDRTNPGTDPIDLSILIFKNS